MNDAVIPPWAVTPEKVEQAVRRLVDAGHPRKVILFGSYVRGEAHRDSDLDVLVVTDDGVTNARKESARLRAALRGIRMCVGRPGSARGGLQSAQGPARPHLPGSFSARKGGL